ncbi:MAG: AgmX/PglI C-terminal domain-containing protein [Myxococcales bacterium]|nr:AgmX/PglI C-terminal domain-containing protein [Myxococcales bacterium]
MSQEHPTVTIELRFESPDAPARTERVERRPGEVLKVGSLDSNDVHLTEPGVSRMHAVLEVASAEQLFVVDLGSAAGTRLNGEKIVRAPLSSGDTLEIGSVRVKVRFGPQGAALRDQPAARASGAGDDDLYPNDEITARSGLPPGVAPAAAPRPSDAAKLPSPFGPSQGEGARRLPDPFAPSRAHGAGDDRETPAIPPPDGSGEARYALLKSGPSVPADEVETTDRAVEVIVMWGDSSVLQVSHLSPPRAFTVGAGDDVDFLIGPEALGYERLPICVPTEATPGKREQGEAGPAGVAVVVPKDAEVEVTRGERVLDEAALGDALEPYAALPGARRVTLGEGDSARVKVRAFTFTVRDVKAGKKVAGTYMPDWEPLLYLLGALLFFCGILLLFYFMPPTPRGLASDVLDTDSRLVQFMIQPKEPEEQKRPEWLKGASGGGEGTRHKLEEGQMGDEQHPEQTHKRYGIKGPKDNETPQMARERAMQEAGSAGAIGVLASIKGAFNAPTSPFGADRALGRDSMSALGAMTGAEIGQNFGMGGLGLTGSGRGGGGTGEGTIGVGRLGTIGRGGGGGTGSGYGSGAGDFRGRTNTVPTVRSGEAVVRGSLSKEVIRRVIQRHRNEVRFCYEQQLNARPDLEGRVLTRFIISPTGTVQAATIAESTLRNANVEQCIARAVERWTFPAPEGGGIVVVTYPFVLSTTGD